MAIEFVCEGCGKTYKVPEAFAGKKCRCKKCGLTSTVPSESDSEPYGLDVPQYEADVEPAPLPPRMAAPKSPLPTKARRSLYEEDGSNERGGISTSTRNAIGGVFGVLIVVLGFGFRAYNGWQRAQNRADRQAQNRPGETDLRPTAPDFSQGNPAPTTGQIPFPNFPEPSQAREIEPGITLQVIDLGPYRPGSPPGQSGKLWLYLPSGVHSARSLPCILISGAGSNLLTGMKLFENDAAEHLPFVRAGFAVVAFEIDGMLPDRDNPTTAAMNEAVGRFLRAKAGLVNARIALEYALTRVRAVDPSRISIAGHSSAGTLAVLFASFEPRLQSCIAYAPVIDIEAFFLRFKGPQMVADMKAQGLEEIFGRLSPRNNESKLDRPLFLFYALDDANAPELGEFANRLKRAGQPITVSNVPSGGHIEPMHRDGIPAAIAWLQQQAPATER